MTGILGTALETITLSGALAVFSEETQRALCVRLTRKAAQAAGIGAMASLAIHTGDEPPIDLIVSMAEELAEELQNLAHIAGQLKASQIAA